MITQTIRLNMIPGGVAPVVNVSQYDIGNNTLIVKLYYGDTEFIIPASASVTIVGTKPDSMGFSYSVESFNGNTAYINITQQMTAVAGDVPCELRIRQKVSGAVFNGTTGFSDHENNGTCNMILRVEPAAMSDDTIISETEIPLIEQAVDIATNLDEYIQETRENATIATAKAEEATDAAAAAAQSETNSATYNANIADLYGSVEDAKAAANTAAENAQAVADDVAGKLSRGELIGPKGDKGDTGESGIIVQAAGMVAFSVDPEDGHLYAYSNTDVSGSYELGEDGHLYYKTEQED